MVKKKTKTTQKAPRIEDTLTAEQTNILKMVDGLLWLLPRGHKIVVQFLDNKDLTNQDKEESYATIEVDNPSLRTRISFRKTYEDVEEEGFDIREVVIHELVHNLIQPLYDLYYTVISKSFKDQDSALETMNRIYNNVEEEVVNTITAIVKHTDMKKVSKSMEHEIIAVWRSNECLEKK